MTPSESLETMRQVNHHLRDALVRLRPERTLLSTIKPQEFSDLLKQLQRATECLRHQAPQGTASAFEQEALDYRRNVETLKHFLPDLQVRLLAEKSRLERARMHVAAAAAWDRARK